MKKPSDESRSCPPLKYPKLTAEGTQWLRENQESLEALNRFTEKNGLFSGSFGLLSDTPKSK